MANMLEVILGFILMSFTFIILLYSLPTLSSATDTTTGKYWENSSDFEKNIINTNHLIVQLLPFILFIIGLSLFFDGMRR